MRSPAEAAALVHSFQPGDDGEASKSRELVLALLAVSPTPFSRYEFHPGHITCTGVVLSADGHRVVLVHHRRLERWLLPGGHVEEEDESLADSARREVIEETGVALASDGAPVLVNIDVHAIPPRGVEPLHLHHDLVFVFRAASEATLCSPESRAVEWCGIDEFDKYDVPGNVRRAAMRAAALERRSDLQAD